VTSFGGVGFQYVGQPAGSGLSGAIDLSPPREFGPQEGTILNQFQFGTQGVRMTFPSPINRLAFELRTIPNAGGVLSLDLFSSGTLVDSFTIPNRETNTGGLGTYFFYGFQSDTLFDQVVLRGPGDGRFGLDNLRFENAGVAAVPEPGTLTLLGLGAFGVLGYGWRRRAGPAAEAGHNGREVVPH
jgi:hypothetical protein